MSVLRELSPLTALWGDSAVSPSFATQGHGPAQAHQGPVGGPDPGVACRAPGHAQVSGGGWGRRSRLWFWHGTPVRVLQAVTAWQSSERSPATGEGSSLNEAGRGCLGADAVQPEPLGPAPSPSAPKSLKLPSRPGAEQHSRATRGHFLFSVTELQVSSLSMRQLPSVCKWRN